MKESSKSLTEDNQQGQGMIEYALILSFVALVVVTAVATLGSSLFDLFGGVVDILENAR